MQKTLLVDGLNLFTRHYVAHPAMSDNGLQIGGIVGFYYNLIDIIERFQPDQTLVVWEGGGSKRKRSLFKEYKKRSRPQRLNRYYDDIPDSIQNRNYQLKTLVDLLNYFPVKQIYVEDCEADDVIGYLCRYKLKDDIKLILSADHDYYQLLNDRTRIWSPTLKALVNTQKVIDRFGVHPTNFCLAKAIVGDKSDNIDGIPGVGFKTLTKNFMKFKEGADYSVGAFLDDAKVLHQTKKGKTITSLLERSDIIKRNHQLVLLDIQNLAHIQVKKVNEIIETKVKNVDKMSALRLLLKQGIKTLNIDRGFLIFKIIKQNQGRQNE